jgi:flagellar protein FliS
MAYATQASSYREMEILSAPPERLVVLLFDHLVVQLHRVKLAIEKSDITLRTVSLAKARGIVSELLASLDFDKGGRIAVDLSNLYSFLLGEFIDVGVRRDPKHVEQLIGIAEELRTGFTGAANAQLQLKRPA